MNLGDQTMDVLALWMHGARVVSAPVATQRNAKKKNRSGFLINRNTKIDVSRLFILDLSIVHF